MYTVYVPGGGKCPSQPGNFDPHTIVFVISTTEEKWKNKKRN